MNKKVVTGLVLISLSINLALISTASSDFQVDWNNQYLSLDSSILKMIPTTDNNYLATGYINDDIALLKISANGTQIWQKSWGTNANERAFDIIETSDEGFLIVGDLLTENNLFKIIVGKFNKKGNEEWSKTFGTNGITRARSVIQTSSKNYLIVGYSNENDRGDYDIYIKKISQTGDEILTRLIGDKGDEFGFDIIENKNKQNSYILTGSSTSFNNRGDTDFFIAEINDELIPQWYNSYQGPGEDDVFSIIQNQDNGYTLIGSTKIIGIEDWDCWIVTTDDDGNHLWNKTFGEKEEEDIRTIIQLANGDYLLGGYHKNTVSFNPLIYLINKTGFIKQKMSINSFNPDLLDSYPNEFAYTMLYYNNSILFGGRLEGIGGSLVSVIKTKELTFDENQSYYPSAESVSQLTGKPGIQIWFNGSGYDTDGSIKHYQWDFNGDGIYEYNSTKTGNTEFRYNKPGNYTAYFKVTDNQGYSVVDKTAVTIKQNDYQNTIETVENPIQCFYTSLILVLIIFISLIIVEKKLNIRNKLLQNKASKLFFLFQYSTWTQYLIYSIIFIFSLKISISVFYATPDIFFDEFSYVITANDISRGQFEIIGNQWFTHGYPAGYSYLLSPAYFLGENMQLVYRGLLFINVLFSVLIMIPCYLIARRFISEKQAFFLSILIATLPAITGHSYIMFSEVTFTFFVLMSCYFLIKLFSYQKNDLFFLIFSFSTGIFIAISVLIRVTGIALFPALFLVIFYKIIKEKSIISLKYAVTLLPFVPAFIYVITSGSNREVGYNVGSYLSRFFSIFNSFESFSQFIQLLINEFLYFALMSYLFFIIFSLLIILQWKQISEKYNNKSDELYAFIIFSFATVLMLMIITVIHIQGNFNLYSRYVFPALPLLFILGTISFNILFDMINKRNIQYLAGITFIIAGLVMFLFPQEKFKIVNNIDLFGFLQRIEPDVAIISQSFIVIQLIIGLVFIPLCIYFLYKLLSEIKENNDKMMNKYKKSFQKKYPYLFIIFISISLIMSIPTLQYAYDIDNAINTSFVSAGQWFNQNDRDASVLIDDYHSTFSGTGIKNAIDWKRFVVATTFWHGSGTVNTINKSELLQIIQNEKEPIADYLLSTHELTDYYQKIKTFNYNWERNVDRRNQKIDFNLYKLK